MDRANRLLPLCLVVTLVLLTLFLIDSTNTQTIAERTTNQICQPTAAPSNTPTIPTVKILSIVDGEIFNGSFVPLKFYVDRGTTWIAYRLDAGDNVTINGNTTITVLNRGGHYIAIYVEDSNGAIGKSSFNDTHFFTTGPTALEWFIIWGIPLIIIILILSLVFGGVIIYFRRRDLKKGIELA